MRALMTLSALGLCLPGAAHAGDDAGDASQAILVATKTSLVRINQDQAEPIAELGDAAVTRIEMAMSGAAALIETEQGVLWTRLGDGAARVEPLDCRPRAHLSPDGQRVVCIDGTGHLALYSLTPSTTRTALGPAVSGHLGFATAGELITSDDKGLWAVGLGETRSRRLLAPGKPDGAFLAAPDGKRAVGVFHEDATQASALYTFRLDGKGTRRRLMRGVQPVAWSRDGQWLAVKDEKRACMVRAAGGQYKCWKGYKAVGIAPDASYLLLVKPAGDKRDGLFHLYKGRRDGVRPDSPALLRRDVAAAAAAY